jgi:leucyl-tRNA synthetase
MIFTNEFSKEEELPTEAADTIIKLLAPFAPHMCEELSQFLGSSDETIAYSQWPKYKEEYLKDDEVEILIQVLGKPRAKIMMPADSPKDKMEELALADERIINAIEGKTVRKVICVPNRLVNIVAN